MPLEQKSRSSQLSVQRNCTAASPDNDEDSHSSGICVVEQEMEQLFGDSEEPSTCLSSVQNQQEQHVPSGSDSSVPAIECSVPVSTSPLTAEDPNPSEDLVQSAEVGDSAAASSELCSVNEGADVPDVVEGSVAGGQRDVGGGGVTESNNRDVIQNDRLISDCDPYKDTDNNGQCADNNGQGVEDNEQCVDELGREDTDDVSMLDGQTMQNVINEDALSRWQCYLCGQLDEPVTSGCVPLLAAFTEGGSRPLDAVLERISGLRLRVSALDLICGGCAILLQHADSDTVISQSAAQHARNMLAVKLCQAEGGPSSGGGIAAAADVSGGINGIHARPLITPAERRKAAVRSHKAEMAQAKLANKSAGGDRVAKAPVKRRKNAVAVKQEDPVVSADEDDAGEHDVPRISSPLPVVYAVVDEPPTRRSSSGRTCRPRRPWSPSDVQNKPQKSDMSGNSAANKKASGKSRGRINKRTH